MKPEEVPTELVSEAIDVWRMQDGSVLDGLTNVLAAVLPAHSVTVHAQLVEQQVAQRIPEVMAQLNEQAAEIKQLSNQLLVAQLKRSNRHLFGLSSARLAGYENGWNDLAAQVEAHLAALLQRAETAEAAIARLCGRLDELIADGFGATTDTLRDLRAALDRTKGGVSVSKDTEIAYLRKQLQAADAINAWDAGQNNLLKAELAKLKAAIEAVRAIVPEIDGTIRSMEGHQLPLAADLRYDLDRLKAALDQLQEPEGSCGVGSQDGVPE